MKKIFLLTFLLSIGICLVAQDIDSLLAEADSLYNKEKYEEAKTVYSKIIKLDRKNAKAYNRKGNCFMNLE